VGICCAPNVLYVSWCGALTNDWETEDQAMANEMITALSKMSYFSSSRHILCSESLLSFRRLSQDNQAKQWKENVPCMMCAMASNTLSYVVSKAQERLFPSLSTEGIGATEVNRCKDCISDI
jgi:hypothetical protein